MMRDLPSFFSKVGRELHHPEPACGIMSAVGDGKKGWQNAVLLH